MSKFKPYDETSAESEKPLLKKKTFKDLNAGEKFYWSDGYEPTVKLGARQNGIKCKKLKMHWALVVTRKFDFNQPDGEMPNDAFWTPLSGHEKGTIYVADVFADAPVNSWG